MSTSITKMNNTVKIAVVQLQVSNDKSANFAQAENLINSAVEQDAKMIFLPECFDFIASSRKETLVNAEFINGPLVSEYKRLAAKNNVWLSLGGMHRMLPSTETDNRIGNTHLVINPRGQIADTYDKVHLYDVQVKVGANDSTEVMEIIISMLYYRLMTTIKDQTKQVTMQESKVIAPGQSCPVVVKNTPIGNLGLAICYDMRFPELAAHLRYVHQAHAIVFPSAFSLPTGQAGHWHTLLRARAIENQCFVIAPAQEGQHNAKRASYGHSLVVDPWGQIVAERSDPGPGLLLCDLDLSKLASVRQAIPVQLHRRFDLFPHQDSGRSRPIGTQSYKFGPHTITADCVFYRSEQSFAFVNLSPLVPGHILVSPVECINRFGSASPAQIADLYLAVRQLAGPLARHFQASSLTISIQDGSDAGQSVPHLHVHVLPRKPNDFARNDDIYKALQNHDKVSDRLYRTHDQMATEAKELHALYETVL